jgi:AGCS family alanine or glycine:cation symporter
MKKKLIVLLFMVVPMLTFAQEKGLDQKIDAAFQPVSDFFSNLIFFTIPIAGIDVPFVLLLLVGSALFFTIYFKFPNIFHFKTRIYCSFGLTN